MRLLLSGEGSTDIGATRPTADGMQFVPGPMAWIVDRLLEPRLGYSILELDETGANCVLHVSEADLIAAGKPGSPLLPGVRFGKETAFFTRNAQLLGIISKRVAAENDDGVIAVMFRDADGTRSTTPLLWQQKFDSIARGFELVEFPSGVPMVPRPKSEAWLICALKDPPYQGCAVLEEESGNDDSPRSLKARLAQLHGGDPGADTQVQWVRDGRIDPTAISMSSFDAFRNALFEAMHVIGLGAAPGN